MKDAFDKRPLSKMYKELNSNKMNNLIKKWAKDPNRHLTKAYIQILIAHKHRKDVQHCTSLKNFQVKQWDIMTYQLEWPTFRMLTTPNAGKMWSNRSPH